MIQDVSNIVKKSPVVHFVLLSLSVGQWPSLQKYIFQAKLLILYGIVHNSPLFVGLTEKYKVQ